MRIVFLGSGGFATPTLRWLQQSEHRVELVVTQPARPGGRGRNLIATDVRRCADELGLRTIEAEDVNLPDFASEIRSLAADLGIVIAFGQKLGRDFLSAIRTGCINLHASLLPKYRGAAPINWAILRGEEKTGCTVFRIVERMDAGPILASRWTYIKPEESAGELHDRLAAVGVDAVQAALASFTDGMPPEGTPQDDARATTAPKLKKSDGHLRFDRPVVEIVRRICAMTPWPGAAARFQSGEGRWEDLMIVRARRAEVPDPPKIPPGTIDVRRYVAASDGHLEILEVKPSSGRLMTWADFVNGRHVAAGDSMSSLDS